MNVPELQRRCEITLLNQEEQEADPVEGIRTVVGDARRMNEIPDQAFDVCFSNSTIEHVGTFADQILVAEEIRRVGRAHFVQTPNRNFPLEPHYLIPFWQFMPLWVRAWLHQHFVLGWEQRQPDLAAARAEVAQIRLLNATELGRLFPDAEIVRERIGCFTKSLMAVSVGVARRE